MKQANSILVIILLIVIGGCKKGKQSTDELIIVDVTRSNYPKKELILQNFMDVEYIALETNDNFVNQGVVQAIGKEIILVINRINDGDIFVYDRLGNALRKINHLGKGSGEYTSILGITLDEENGEMFVNNYLSREFIVYDLYGNLRRSFKHKESNGSLFYTDVFNFDNDHLICYDKYNEEIAFVLISKQDGGITKEINISLKEKKFLRQKRQDGDITIGVHPGLFRAITPYDGKWILSEFSSDTVYSFLPDYSLRPFLVRTPSILSMDPEVMLLLRFFSDRYYFIETIKNVFDFDKKEGFPRTFLMYDKQEKAFFGYKVYNGDYSIQKEIYMNVLRPVNQEIESWQALEAYDLVESYQKRELKGRLKEVAAELNEESNPVIMLVKHKKQ